MKNFWENNKKIIILIGALFFFCLLFLTWKIKKASVKPQEELILEEVSLTSEEPQEIPVVKFYVEIKGAINNPGVYEVQEGQIINDLVTLAGGFTKDAYTDNVNLSYELQKEMVIYIYTETEYKKSTTKEVIKVVEKDCQCEDYVISDCTDNKNSVIVPSNDGTSSSLNKDDSNSTPNNSTQEENKSQIININTAGKSELMTLKGIGEAKAQKIIEYRSEHGLFTKIEDLKKVSGIGEAIYEKIKAYITV